MNAMDIHPWLWDSKETAQGFADPVQPSRKGQRQYEQYLDEKAKNIQINAITDGYHPQTGRPAKAFKWADGENCLPGPQGTKA